ncbi:CDC27 family protein [Vicingaceae bacterium]|nr:CDC27 family protein [Vicingaceae bacterium]
MAKHTPKNEELIVDVQEVYSKTETFIDQNKSLITGLVGGIIVLIASYFAYNSLYLSPLEEEAREEMFMAEKYFRLDSFNVSIDGRADFAGFIEIADKYGSTKAGDLANYYLGMSFLNMGQFESAIDALNQFDGDDEILATLAIGAKGDALLELENTDKAIDQYEKAANRKTNEFTTPLFLMKAARAQELLGDYKAAAENYTKIKEEYKKSPEANDIDKFIARAEAKL